MNLRSLEYFITLAREKHFKRAADFCGVSQPALSIQLKKLEAELGLQLFERHNKQIIITCGGQQMLQHAKGVLQKVKDMKEAAHNCGDIYRGDLKIGAFPTLSPYLFPRIIPDLRGNYPDIKFYLFEEKTADLLNKLLEGLIDAAFIALPHEDGRLVCDFVFQENFWLAIPADHTFSKRKYAPNDLLQQESLLLLSEGHCLRDQALAFLSGIRFICTSNYRVICTTRLP